MKKLLLMAMAATCAFSGMAADYNIVTDPKGEKTYYNRESYGWYMYGGTGTIEYGRVPGLSHIVWSADGTTAWIKNPLTANSTGAYLTCTVDGDKLTAQLPQVLDVLVDGSFSTPLYIGKMNPTKVIVDGEEAGITYMPVESDDTMSWTIHPDGTITMDHEAVELTLNGDFANGYPENVLGTYYFEKNATSATWNAVADWAQTYTLVETGEITTIPENLEVQQWQLSTKDVFRMIDIAVDGSTIYLANISPYAPGAAIVGTLADGKATFPTGQYIGFNEQYGAPVYFISAMAEWETYDFGETQMTYIKSFNRTEALELTYDAEHKKYTSAKDATFIINGGNGETNYFEYQVDPVITYLSTDGMDANPRNPRFLGFSNEGMDGYLYEWEIPSDNVNGVQLNTDRMYYNIYVNGELYTFYTDTHYHFTEDMTDIPYNFTDNYDVQVEGTKRGFYLHAEGIENVAVVSYFLGNDGVLYHSATINSNWPNETDPVNAAPKNPVLTVDGADFGADGILYRWEIPAENVNDVALDTDRMYYNIFIDGQLYTFNKRVYTELEENMTDIPYNFTDNWDFERVVGDLHGIYFHIGNIENMGIQSCFRGTDGEIYKSEIVNNRYDSVGDAAISVVTSQSWYDLQGRRIVSPSHGVYVRVSQLSDGSVAVKKVLVKE